MAKTLREGFTTGTAAAAAAKAATLALFTGRLPERVSVALPPFFLENAAVRQDGTERLDIPVAGGALSPGESAMALVIKDGGDDPDATHGAAIRVHARFAPPAGAAPDDPRPSLTLPGGILLQTGEGVGIATLPGLPVAAGEPAVNPEPRKQIAFAVTEAVQEGMRAATREAAQNAIQNAAQNAGCEAACEPPLRLIRLLLEVPDGAERARRTLNARLGIVGGISILGTRGTVRPYSHDAWQATISQGMAVAKALGITELLLSTGRRSERLGFALFPQLPPQAGIQVADYAAHALREAAKGGFARLRWVCFPGKLLKLAQGLEWTHARSGPADIAMLARLAREAGCDAPAAARIAAMPTAAGAFETLAHAPALHDAVLRRLGNAAHEQLLGWLHRACREHGAAAPFLTLHVFGLHTADREGRPSTDADKEAAAQHPLMSWGEDTRAAGPE